MSEEHVKKAAASTMHQISEEDLCVLERTLPQLGIALMPALNNRLRTQLRQVQTILSNVRWDYGPASHITTVPVDGDQTL